jgi:hypothetical protein
MYTRKRKHPPEAKMQRNMDLVRLILLKIEANPSTLGSRSFGIPGYLPEDVGYHVHIMMEDGLITGVDLTSPDSRTPQAVPTALTWKGHEILDLARDLNRWIQTKATISKVGSAPIAVWVKVLQELVLKELGVAS